jgi:hypothetical protein
LGDSYFGNVDVQASTFKMVVLLKWRVAQDGQSLLDIKRGAESGKVRIYSCP